MNDRTCSRCGAELLPDGAFCVQCGAPLGSPPRLPNTHDERGVGARPHLFLDCELTTRVGENGLLGFGIVRPSGRSIECHLDVRPALPDDFEHFDGSRRLRLDRKQEGWTYVHFRALRPGRHLLSIRLFVRELERHSWIRCYEVPAHTVHFSVSNLVERNITINPSLTVQENYGGEVRLSVERLCQSLPSPRDGDDRVRELPLEHPELGAGYVPSDASGWSARHIRLDVRRDERLVQRFHLLFSTRMRFGRNTRENDVALHWLPIPSPDHENWHRTLAISRQCGHVEVDERRSWLRVGGSGCLVDGKPASPELEVALGAGQVVRVDLGLESAPFGLELRACGSLAMGRDPLAVFDGFADRTRSSGVAGPSTHHSAVSLRRTNNLEQVGYALVPRWASVGGGRHDTCPLSASDTPPALFLVTRSRGKLYLWGDPDQLESIDAPHARGLWRPLIPGERLRHRSSTFTFHPSSASETKAEHEVVEVLDVP